MKVESNESREQPVNGVQRLTDSNGIFSEQLARVQLLTDRWYSLQFYIYIYTNTYYLEWGPRDTFKSLITPRETSYTQPCTKTSLPIGLFPFAQAFLMTWVWQRFSTWAITFSRTRTGRASWAGTDEICRLAAKVVSGTSQRLRGESEGWDGTVTGVWPGTKVLQAPKQAAAAPHSVCPTTTTIKRSRVGMLYKRTKERKHRVLHPNSRQHMWGLPVYCHREGELGCKRSKWATSNMSTTKTPYFPILRLTKMSPGLAPVTTDSGTRESAHPIQRV